VWFSLFIAIANALLFLKIDVIGVITAISNVGAIQTKMRQGQSLRRAITIRLPR